MDGPHTGGKSSLEFPAAPVPVVDSHWPGLAYSIPAVTTWCSHFLSWGKRRETRLRPAPPGCTFDGLPVNSSPTAAVNSKDWALDFPGFVQFLVLPAALETELYLLNGCPWPHEGGKGAVQGLSPSPDLVSGVLGVGVLCKTPPGPGWGNDRNNSRNASQACLGAPGSFWAEGMMPGGPDS